MTIRLLVPIAALGVFAGCSDTHSSPYASYNYAQPQYRSAVSTQPVYLQTVAATVVDEPLPPKYVPNKSGPGSRYQRELEEHNRKKAAEEARKLKQKQEADKLRLAEAARNREKQISEFLDSGGLLGGKVKDLRRRLKSSIQQHDSDLQSIKKIYTQSNRVPDRDLRYIRLKQSRANIKTRLDNLDNRIENAILDKVTGSAAEDLIWRDEDLKAVDELYSSNTAH